MASQKGQEEFIAAPNATVFLCVTAACPCLYISIMFAVLNLT